MTSSGSTSRPVRLIGVGAVFVGVGLLAGGREVFRLLQKRPPDSVDDDAITLLGIRYVGQGLAQLVAPRHGLRLYAGVDTLHAASMLALAVGQPQRRRAALVSGGVAAVNAWLCTRSALADRRPRHSAR